MTTKTYNDYKEEKEIYALTSTQSPPVPKEMKLNYAILSVIIFIFDSYFNNNSLPL
jgi:hypothetical protein